VTVTGWSRSSSRSSREIGNAGDVDAVGIDPAEQDRPADDLVVHFLAVVVVPAAVVVVGHARDEIEGVARIDPLEEGHLGLPFVGIDGPGVRVFELLAGAAAAVEGDHQRPAFFRLLALGEQDVGHGLAAGLQLRGRKLRPLVGGQRDDFLERRRKGRELLVPAEFQGAFAIALPDAGGGEVGGFLGFQRQRRPFGRDLAALGKGLGEPGVESGIVYGGTGGTGEQDSGDQVADHAAS
jgi:hypothetical protein